jgi:hypothetical protein
MRRILPPGNTSKTFRRASDLNNLLRAGWKAEPSSLTMLDEAPESSHEKTTRDSIQGYERITQRAKVKWPMVYDFRNIKLQAI